MAENTKANIPAVPDLKLELVPVPVIDAYEDVIFDTEGEVVNGN